MRKEVSVLLCKVIELHEVYVGANRWHSIPSVTMKIYKEKFLR